jgi:hypothetical protein
VVEGTGLENRHTGEPGIVSSNLTLSAVKRFCAPARRQRADRAGFPFNDSMVRMGGRVV